MIMRDVTLRDRDGSERLRRPSFFRAPLAIRFATLIGYGLDDI